MSLRLRVKKLLASQSERLASSKRKNIFLIPNSKEELDIRLKELEIRYGLEHCNITVFCIYD